MSLPHRFPFRLVEGRRGARAQVRLTATAHWLRDPGELSLGLLAEMMAQGAALLLRDPRQSEGDRLLAGLEGVSCRQRIFAGDTLEIEATLEARLGGAVRVAVVVFRDEVEVASGRLLLAAT